MAAYSTNKKINIECKCENESTSSTNPRKEPSITSMIPNIYDQDIKEDIKPHLQNSSTESEGVSIYI